MLQPELREGAYWEGAGESGVCELIPPQLHEAPQWFAKEPCESVVGRLHLIGQVPPVDHAGRQFDKAAKASVEGF